MNWLDTKAFLASQKAVVDSDVCATVTLQGAALRVSFSEKTQHVGIVADVATAKGITAREVLAAGKGLPHGRLVVVSERLLLCHLAPIASLGHKELAAILSSMAAHVVRLRMQWSMPILAA